jgi:hypothetical protein
MGLTPTLMREMPGNAIYFSSYEFFKYARRTASMADLI